ncbi:14 kDa phosphohistidine phosphatase [Vipera latastei]
MLSGSTFSRPFPPAVLRLAAASASSWCLIGRTVVDAAPRQCARRSSQAGAEMAEGGLAGVPDVLIDPDGVFKYVLIHVNPAAGGPGKDIVRGHAWAEYHADLFERACQEMAPRGFGCLCLGGGRISHRSGAKKIHVYGYSVGFGRAKHAVATEMLKARYPDYEVTWADEGY